MSKYRTEQAKRHMAQTQADGQHRTGTAARACCPADPTNVIAELDRMLEEVRQAQTFLSHPKNGHFPYYIEGWIGGLVELRERLTGKPEEGPAGNSEHVGPA